MIDYLRILIYMNPLTVNKFTKEFLYWKDSGFICTKNIISKMPESFRFYWLVPESLKESDKEWFYEANKNIDLIPYKYHHNIHQNRYEFNGEKLRRYFNNNMDVDVVFNNQPEVTANINCWMLNARRDYPILLSFFHWIDCAESQKFASILKGYFWREYDGFLTSDVSYFHTEHAYNLFKKEGLKYLKEFPDNKKHGLFHPPPTKFPSVKIDLPDKKIILFNHRLNNTTGWIQVLNQLKKLYEKRQDFVVWLTDDSSIKSSTMTGYPFTIIKSIPTDNYGYLLKNAHSCLCNVSGYATWNMSVLDAFYNGGFSLLPNAGVFKDMFGDLGAELGIYHNYTNIAEAVERVLNTPKEELDKITNEIVKLDIFKNESHISILSDIEELLKKKNATSPKKYEDVKNYILDKGRVTKSEFVREFWTFVTNSNFHKIRTKLLFDGIKDDTSSKETIYTSNIIATTKTRKGFFTK